jgi:hypothetical protein
MDLWCQQEANESELILRTFGCPQFSLLGKFQNAFPKIIPVVSVWEAMEYVAEQWTCCIRSVHFEMFALQGLNP